MQNLDEETIIELSGVVFELRELGDLDSEIAILPDGRFEVISEHTLTWLPSLAYKFMYSDDDERDYGQEVYNYYLNVIIRMYPVLNQISKAISKVVLPREGEIKIYPILYFLGGKIT